MSKNSVVILSSSLTSLLNRYLRDLHKKQRVIRIFDILKLQHTGPAKCRPHMQGRSRLALASIVVLE